jgi:hypothetical protein
MVFSKAGVIDLKQEKREEMKEWKMFGEITIMKANKK